MQHRIAELMDLGLTNFDAMHVASAEEAGANLLATTDDRLISAVARADKKIRIEVCSVLQCLEKVSR